ncbi:CbtA family protein [Pararhizobium sp. DWP3-4]|uniref:CbtA family protein n=1 Tax=Pararhizobium sp. DWP3-4 TaxID=2804565 RepID=UPI003CFAA27D
MIQKLLIAGMLSGFLISLAAFGYARLFAEPTIELSISMEQDADAHGTHPHEETISRNVQRNAGLFTGIASFSVALGGLLAILVAFTHGRIGVGTRASVWLVTAASYASVVVLPQLKYPASPPGVGAAETIGSRTELFFIAVLVSIASVILSIWVTLQLGRYLSFSKSALVGTVVFIGLASLAHLALPTVDEVPDAFPRELLQEFRLHAWILQVIIWGGLGVVFAEMAKYLVDNSDLDNHAVRYISPNA